MLRRFHCLGQPDSGQDYSPRVRVIVHGRPVDHGSMPVARMAFPSYSPDSVCCPLELDLKMKKRTAVTASASTATRISKVLPLFPPGPLAFQLPHPLVNRTS